MTRAIFHLPYLAYITLCIGLVFPQPAYALNSSDIQQQINNLPTSGGEIVLPVGIHTLNTVAGSVENFPDGSPINSALIINKNNVTLRGQGSQTILQLSPGAKMRAISITANNITIKNLVVDGNKSNRNGSVPYPDGDVVDTLIYGDQNSSNIHIDNIETRNGIEDGIGFWRSHQVTVNNIYSHDNGTPEAGAAGISLSGVTDGQATNNIIQNNTATGIWSAFDASNITIQNNQITNNSSGGITIGGGTVFDGLGPNNSGFTVSDNTLDSNGSAGFASLTIFASQNGTVSNNTISNSYFDSIQVDGTPEIFSKSWLISSNNCTITSNTDLGILLLSNSQDINLENNNCSTQATSNPADLNSDGQVNIFDYNILVTGYGTDYDIFDYNKLVNNYEK